MKRHLHHCGYLRVLELDARDISRARKGGRQILEELCEAKRLTPCVGLAECDVLTPLQKRSLLATRATELRRQEGGRSALADREEPRAAELEALRSDLLDERNAIAEENRRRAAEAGGAMLRNPRVLGPDEYRSLARAGISVVDGAELRELRLGRLDAIDRALDALARGGFGDCIRCGSPIEIERLRNAPDTHVCKQCALAAVPEVGLWTQPGQPATR
jgi:RNA polymerase-binding transcription factor DksA